MSQIEVTHQHTGAWSKEEEAQLVEIMAEFDYEKPKGEENDTFWRQISHRMGGSRGRHQLRSKWYLDGTLSIYVTLPHTHSLSGKTVWARLSNPMGSVDGLPSMLTS
jgi:hypothetical protein